MGEVMVDQPKPMFATISELHGRIEASVGSGDFTGASDVLLAGIRAMEHDMLREKVQEAINDPSPGVPAGKVFAEIRAAKLSK